MKNKPVKLYLLILLITTLFSFVPQNEETQNTAPPTKEIQQALTPSLVLNILKQGNQRFISNHSTLRNLPQEVKQTAPGQYPLAMVLTCIDSRTPPELIFDQGLGSIFDARIAGNTINKDILGSMEFACKISGAKLIVVMGHTACGAVKGACDHVQLGNLTQLLQKIQPAVDSTITTGERNSKNKEFVKQVAHQNVIETIRQIRKQSAILNEMEQQGSISLVGAMYNIETGEVEFYNAPVDK